MDVYDPVEFQNHLQKEPGEIYSITEQCELYNGKGSTQGCGQVGLNFQTKQLWQRVGVQRYIIIKSI